MASITTDCGVAVCRLALYNAISNAHVAAPIGGDKSAQSLYAYVYGEQEFSAHLIRFRGQRGWTVQLLVPRSKS